jgi:signal transduction histidine kinase
MDIMPAEERSLEVRYRHALLAHVHQEAEQALMDGLELGRIALTEGYGLLDLLSLHHSIVYSLIEPEVWSFQERLVRANEFLTQVVAPFEMAHRGWRDVIHQLRVANEELETRVATVLERERSRQTEFERVARLTTMGALTASIAHEINQPLAAITMDSHAGLRWLSKEPPNLNEVRAALENIARDGERAVQVIDSLRAMFKSGSGEKRPLALKAIIEDIVRLLHGEIIKHQILVRTELRPDLPQVVGDRTQLQQVFMNLIMNAIEAMQFVESRERLLEIKSETADPATVIITVEDSGTGIDQNDTERIFDALFTTKSKGMGMGLSICRSIIEAHGGRLWASPRATHGSMFKVVLPSSSL